MTALPAQAAASRAAHPAVCLHLHMRVTHHESQHTFENIYIHA